MAYQGTFAIITAALISGAIVERMRFGPYLAFIALWTILVYAPVAHWVWGGGWLMTKGVLDFAGGTVVHINAGVSALVAALVLGVRKDYGRQAILPHNVPFVLLGAGLLWFGWFGFNGGSALAANELAALAFTNTFLAPMATLVVWVLLDYFRTGRATAVGGATGIVIGLVAITPAGGLHQPDERAAARRPGGVPELLHHRLPARAPGWTIRSTSSPATASAASPARCSPACSPPRCGTRPATTGSWPATPRQLGTQALGVLSSIVYSAIATFVILKVMSLVTSLRTVARSEGLGMDVTQHGEEAYANGEGSILVMPDTAAAGAPAPAFTPHPVAR